jgi:RHS repeat-associated protein
MRWRSDQADPFGSAAPNQNPASIGVFNYNPRFPGQFYDVESNLHYNYFRDYDPRVGRYTQSDPIGLAGGINTYAYVFNQPTKYTDPDGRIVPAIAACAANPACVAAVGAGAIVVGAAARDAYDRWTRRPEPIRLDPGYVPGQWPPRDPPTDKPERWPQDPKNQCIRLYAICKDFSWTGNCDNCLRRCIAEQEWPFHLCDGPKGCKGDDK